MSSTSAKTIYLLILLACSFYGCGQEGRATQVQAGESKTPPAQPTDTIGHTIETRFPAPAGYRREAAEKASFATHLRKLPLKPPGAEVLFYNGQIKPNNPAYKIYEAVVNLPIGNKDLHQCADAIMRLRADYLYAQGRFQEIHFNFTNGFRADYAEWMKGKRMVVKGNNTHWALSASPSNTYQSYWKYMELIFNYAGTLSLEKELKPVPLEEMQIGDVFIHGGSPGHAVIVIDMAVNQTGEKLFMLAQSYMPAQELQVLANQTGSAPSPWYALSFTGHELYTPQWTFKKTDLKRF